MNKVIAAVVILVILVAGGVALSKHNNATPSNTYSNNPSSTNSTSSGNSASSTGTNSSTTPAPGAIKISNMMFTPSQISVSKGATVTWTNNDSVTHNVEDDLTNVGGPASGDIAPSSSYTFTFNKTGSFQYHCSIHPSMRGTIVVK